MVNGKRLPSEGELLKMADTDYMNEQQLGFFKHRLQQMERELLQNADETTEHLREDTSIVPDPADRATIEEEHALELRTRDRERKLLKKISQSIARIDVELGLGFHGELTGRENVVLHGTLMGFSRREMLERMDRIVEFAELESFLDTPIRNYSTGMVTRLAFAVATDVDPEILLVHDRRHARPELIWSTVLTASGTLGLIHPDRPREHGSGSGSSTCPPHTRPYHNQRRGSCIHRRR